MCRISELSYHCRYTKYYYQKKIPIIRVTCLSCSRTHALIPEFSLPGTSIGTEEANTYISLRKKGASQINAIYIFTTRGMSEKYGRGFELMIRTASVRAMALFPDEYHLYKHLIKLSSPGNTPENIIQRVNQTFSQKGYNPLYFSRRNILRVRENKLGISIPLNKGTTWFQTEPLNSS